MKQRMTTASTFLLRRTQLNVCDKFGLELSKSGGKLCSMFASLGKQFVFLDDELTAQGCGLLLQPTRWGMVIEDSACPMKQYATDMLRSLSGCSTDVLRCFGSKYAAAACEEVDPLPGQRLLQVGDCIQEV